MAGPWRVPTDGRSDRVSGRYSSSPGLEPSLRDRVTKSACSRSGRRRPVAPRRPPMRFVAPPAHPPWRVHFPEPDPESVHAADALPCSDLSPEGDSSVSRRLRGSRPRPCPTTDESVAVEDGSASRECPSTRERPACGGSTGDQRMRPEGRSAAGAPGAYPGAGIEILSPWRARTVRPSIRRWTFSRLPGGLQRPIAPGPVQIRLTCRCGCSPRGATAPERRRDPVRIGPWVPSTGRPPTPVTNPVSRSSP
jgi:hypothetical protein